MASPPNPPLPGVRGTFDSLFLKPPSLGVWGEANQNPGEGPDSYLVKERLINGIIFE